MYRVSETHSYNCIYSVEGVYQPYPIANFSDRIIYWHVVRLIGWGIGPNNTHHWLCVNSFGQHWGDNGKCNICDTHHTHFQVYFVLIHHCWRNMDWSMKQLLFDHLK